MTNSILKEQENSSKHSGLLNWIALTVSMILVPFTIVGTIFTIDFVVGGPSKHWWNFLVAMCITSFVAITFYILLYLFMRREEGHKVPKWVMDLKHYLQSKVHRPARSGPFAPPAASTQSATTTGARPATGTVTARKPVLMSSVDIV
jgi:hypothetical protein